MDKSKIIAKIKELADENGGHIGFEVFLDATGIKRGWLRRQLWFTTWNDLLAEQGRTTRKFSTVKTEPEKIVEAVAQLILRISAWPTDDQLLQERSRDSTFPSINVIRPIRKTGELARLISNLGVLNSDFALASKIASKQIPTIAKEIYLLPQEKIKGYVYVLRSGRRFKIGKSNDPSRRYREVKLELPEETIQVHTIATDDPSGIEAYWHTRFAAKRVRNTEFFDLNADDVRALKRRTYQ
jgi:hypothetical protein